MSLQTVYLTYLVCVCNNGNKPSYAQANGVKPKCMACTVNAPQMQKNPKYLQAEVSTSHSRCYFQSSMLELSQVKWKYPPTSARHCLHSGLWAIAISNNHPTPPMPLSQHVVHLEGRQVKLMQIEKKKKNQHIWRGEKVGKGGCEPRLWERECAHRRLDREWEECSYLGHIMCWEALKHPSHTLPPPTSRWTECLPWVQRLWKCCTQLWQQSLPSKQRIGKPSPQTNNVK